MSRTKKYTGMGLLIYNAVQKMGIKREDAAGKLNISPSTLFGYFSKPPKDIEALIDLSAKLETNLLAFYKDRMPLKGMLDEKNLVIQGLEEEIISLKKDNKNLLYTIELQKDALKAQKEQGR
jgi:hypothetical protein